MISTSERTGAKLQSGLLDALIARACTYRLRTHGAAPQVETRSRDSYSDWREATLLNDLRSHFPAFEVRDARVLDFGCGRGELSFALVQAGAQRVIGVDLNAADLRQARERSMAGTTSAAVEFRLGTETAIPIESGSIDAVLCFDVMEHVIEFEAIIAEWRRVLAPGGRVLIRWILWSHPYGHHCYPLVNVPWIHLFVSDYTLLRVAERVFDSPEYRALERPFWHRDASAAMPDNPYATETTVADYLNKLSPRGFEAACSKAGLTVVRKEVLPFSGERGRSIKRFLASLPILGDAFCSGVVYELALG